jgi:hypothetical protein
MAGHEVCAMNPTSLQSVSEATQVEANLNTTKDQTKQQIAAVPPEDKVDFSAKAQARVLKQQGRQSQSSAALDLNNQSGSTAAHSSHSANANLSEIQRAKLLKQQGNNTTQIAIDLNVPPKAIEEDLDITESSSIQTVVGQSTTGS